MSPVHREDGSHCYIRVNCWVLGLAEKEFIKQLDIVPVASENKMFSNRLFIWLGFVWVMHGTDGIQLSDPRGQK